MVFPLDSLQQKSRIDRAETTFGAAIRSAFRMSRPHLRGVARRPRRPKSFPDPATPPPHRVAELRAKIALSEDNCKGPANGEFIRQGSGVQDSGFRTRQ
jgi:hypothetical protein